jgi:hypothetical protein
MQKGGMNALKEHRHVLFETTMLQWFWFFFSTGSPVVDLRQSMLGKADTTLTMEADPGARE